MSKIILLPEVTMQPFTPCWPQVTFSHLQYLFLLTFALTLKNSNLLHVHSWLALDHRWPFTLVRLCVWSPCGCPAMGGGSLWDVTVLDLFTRRGIPSAIFVLQMTRFNYLKRSKRPHIPGLKIKDAGGAPSCIPLFFLIVFWCCIIGFTLC